MVRELGSCTHLCSELPRALACIGSRMDRLGHAILQWFSARTQCIARVAPGMTCTLEGCAATFDM
eukprot:11234621-Alexandrium_andersonii.AAC.1